MVMFIRAKMILLLCALPLATHAGSPILEYDFTGLAPAMNLPWTNTAFRSAGIDQDGWLLGGGAFPVAGISNGIGFYVDAGTNLTTLADAISAEAYLAVGVEPVSEPLNLNGVRVRFSIQRESYHAPRRYALFSSLTGFAAGDVLFATDMIENGDLGRNDFTYILPLNGLDGITNRVEWRIVAYDALYAYHNTALRAFSLETTSNVYSLAVNATAGGSAYSIPAGERFEEGESVVLHAQANPDVMFAGWSGDAISRLNPAHHVITNDSVITATFKNRAMPPMDIGMNIESINDWSETWFFQDQFMMARSWQTQNADGGGAWSTGYAPPVDAQGWPLYSPFVVPQTNAPQVPHTVIGLLQTNDHYLVAEGVGRIEFYGPSSQRFYYDFTGGVSTQLIQSGAVGLHFLKIDYSDTNNPVRNIRILTPDYPDDSVYPFHPEFVSSLAPFKNIRFMDWMKTNGSPVTNWAGRTRADSYTQAAASGVALELIIEFCNLTGKDPWICVPHGADDVWVQNAADLFYDTLDSNLVVYVEYSNETWNSAPAFSQTIYVQDMGEAQGLSGDRWQAGQMFAAKRSAEIWHQFEQVFGNDSRNRLCKVLAAHSANPSTAQQRLAYLSMTNLNPHGIAPDALAIAPYFGRNFTLSDIPPQAPSYPSLDEILDIISPAEIELARGHVRTHRQMADQHGLRLICYEGGQHFIGHLGAENDTNLVNRLIEANRDPRMGQRYLEYFQMLNEEGVDLFSNFTFVGSWSKWGTWSVLEYQQQPVESAPKMKAIQDWQTQHPARPVLDMSRQGDRLLIQGHLPPGIRYRLESSSVVDGWDDFDVERGDPVVGQGWVIDLFDERFSLLSSNRFWRLIHVP